MDELISRQAAIDALHTWFRDGFDEDKWWNSTHVLAAIEGLPPAQPEPCEIEQYVETCEECGFCDTISRKSAIDAFDGVKVDEENCTEYDIGYNDGIDFAISKLSVLPPAQPEYHEIGYRECADAVLKMWMDNVLTDGEYNRIINKLNAKWAIAEGDSE